MKDIADKIRDEFKIIRGLCYYEWLCYINQMDGNGFRTLTKIDFVKEKF